MPPKLGRLVWDQEMDLKLLEQVILYNPWLPGHTWRSFEKYIMDNKLLSQATEKGLRDHTLMLIGRREKVLQQEEKASGIEVKELTNLEKAADEVLKLKKDGEVERNPVKKRKQEANAAKIVEAAMTTTCTSQTDRDDETVSPPFPKKRSSSGSLAQVLNCRMEFELQVREKEKKEKEEEQKREVDSRKDELELKRLEIEQRRSEVEREQELRKKELELREREMKLREKQADAAAEQQMTLMKLLIDQLKNQSK